MASCSGVLSEEQFQCSICREVFSSPVSTPCGHSFCKACINGHWASRDVCQCPKCKRIFLVRPGLCENTFAREMAEKLKRLKLGRSEPHPAGHEEVGRGTPGVVACDVCNGRKGKAVRSCLVCLTSYCQEHLKSHSTRFTKHKLIQPVSNLQDHICKKHDRPLELFCRSDQTCVCVLCNDTDHQSHDTVPAERAWAEQKTQLKKTEADVQQMVQERQRKVEEIRQCVELSRSSTQREIEDSVQVFSALMRSIERRQAELTESFPSLCTPPHTKDWSDVGVHTDVCVGTVRRAVTQLEDSLMEQVDKLTDKVAVILDAATAHPWLALSGDRMSVQDGDMEQDVPDGQQRFDTAPCVLGSEGFTTGRRYWEVQVGDKTAWDVGVASQSINRKGVVTLTPDNGYWALCLRKGNEYRACSDPSIFLPLREKPRTVGVYVDYELGQVSFYNVETRSHIYSFTGYTFTEKLYPYLCPDVKDHGSNAAPMVIVSPVNHMGGGACL
ncbi:hypothetical protein AGOR_G00187330 [Albula goreensis]|uniref:E3 ubiquitin-protein ligase TRIM39-like n=1 Tax=Albula goreensis TaxID=1534307 RepID=A0A8T3CY32_9TELE|nr:hypothetical protein AGOR_G00187330 [Albula goreensis]